MKKKGFVQLRQDAMFTQVVDALARTHPEFTVNESTFGVCYAMPYAWNDGQPGRQCVSVSATVNLSGEYKSTSRIDVEPMKEIYAHQEEVQKALESPSQLLFVFFGVDNAIAFTRIRPLNEYRCTMYKHYAVPVDEIAFVTKFTGEYANVEFSAH